MYKFPIKGTIISDNDAWIYRMFGIACASPAMVSEELANAEGDDVEITLNSGGGSVFAGSEIRELIRSYEGNVVIKIAGIAASAASVIATACECEIAPTGMVMIHNASASASGDYREMDQASQMLVKVNTSIANAYIEKTGMKQSELFELMNNETYMTAQEAVERGFVDRISQSKQSPSNANLEFLNSLDMPDSEKMIESVLKIASDISAGNTDALPKELNARIAMQNMQDAELTSTTEDNSVENKNNKEDTEVTLQELREQHPELGAEIDTMLEAAREEGISSERKRMQDIDSVAGSIPAEMVRDAKYDNIMNAEGLALKFLAQGKEAAKNYMQDAKEDSSESGAESVGAGTSDVDDEARTANLYNLMVNSANEGMEARKNGSESDK